MGDPRVSFVEIMAVGVVVWTVGAALLVVSAALTFRLSSVNIKFKGLWRPCWRVSSAWPFPACASGVRLERIISSVLAQVI